MTTFGGTDQGDEDTNGNEVSIPSLSPSVDAPASKAEVPKRGGIDDVCDDGGVSDRIKDLVKIIQGETSKTDLLLGCELPHDIVQMYRTYTTLKLPVEDHDWDELIKAGLTWHQLCLFCDGDVAPHLLVQIGPMCLSNREFDNYYVSVAAGMFHEVLELGINDETIHIYLIRKAHASDEEECASSQYISMLKGLLELYTLTYRKQIYCTIHGFSPATIWAYSFDWGVIIDRALCGSGSVPFGTSPYVAPWLARHCRDLNMWNTNAPIKSFLPYLLVNADSNVKNLFQLHIKGHEVGQFSAILQQSLQVEELDMVLLEFSPSEVTKLIRALCRCPSLKRVHLWGEPCSTKLRDWVQNMILLIQCGHLQVKAYDFEVDDAEFDAMPFNEVKTLKLSLTQKILDAMEGNTNLKHLVIRNPPWWFIDVDKIKSAMRDRGDKASGRSF